MDPIDNERQRLPLNTIVRKSTVEEREMDAYQGIVVDGKGLDWREGHDVSR